MRRRNLTFKFTLMFAMSTLLTLVISSILSYINQTTLYKQQREESVQFVASHLEELLMADDIYFVWYQQYFLEKGGDFLIPYDFDDASIQESRHKYEDIFAKDFPGLVLAEDIMFDDLSEDEKNGTKFTLTNITKSLLKRLASGQISHTFTILFPKMTEQEKECSFWTASAKNGLSMAKTI